MSELTVLGLKIADFIAAVAAFIALLALLASLHSLRKQQQQAKDLHEVELIMKLEDRWDSPDVRRARLRAASFLLDAGCFVPERAESWVAASDLLDFFQSVGLFRRFGHVRAELAHSCFCYWLQYYYLRCEAYIEYERKASPGTWDDVVALYEEFVAIDKRKGWYVDTITNDDMTSFLREEHTANHPDELSAA